MDKSFSIKIIFFVALFFIAVSLIVDTLDSISERDKTLRQKIESSYGTEEIKEAIATLKLDNIDILIYDDDDEEDLDVVFLYNGYIESAGISFYDIGQKDLFNKSMSFEQKYGKQIVLGICDKNESDDITVNGKKVKSQDITYTYQDHKVQKELWYILIKNKSDDNYTIKSDNDEIYISDFSYGDDI